jgi:hypothetical protein
MKCATLLVTLLVIPLMTSCAAHWQDDADSPRHLAERQIFAAVIAHQAAQPAHVAQVTTKVLFVSVGQQSENDDPDQAILLLIQPGPVAVEPFSACDFAPAGIIEHRTGARGLLLQLGAVRWENDDQANLTATTWDAQGSGVRQVYHMAKKNGQWIVQECRPFGAA